MKVNSTKKNKFKRVINIILAVLMGIVSFISVAVFTLACIGSCSSKTATVMADSSPVDYFYDGNYFTPTCNFYPVDDGIRFLPNNDSSQAFMLGTDVVIYLRTDNLPDGVSSVPVVAVKSSFVLSSQEFVYKGHREGYDYIFNVNTVAVNGGLYYSLDSSIAFSGNDGFMTGHSMYYFGLSSNYNQYYSCLYYDFDTTFNCDVVSITYNGFSSDTFQGYARNCNVNTVTYTDSNNKQLTLYFYTSNAFGSSPTFAYLWQERTYYLGSSSSADYQQGYQNGYNQGYQDGVAEGDGSYDDGYENGYDDGFDVGYGYGYNLGYDVGSNNELTSENFFNKVFSIFNVKIFGFLSLGDIFKIVFVLGIGIWALKVFAGG